MDIGELESALREKGLYPVRIQEYMAEDDDLTFDGKLDDFLNVAKDMNIRPIFLAARRLDADEFSHTPDPVPLNLFDDDEEDQENEEPANIYLPDIFPELRRYTERIGDAGAFRIGLRAEQWTLNYFLEEEWWQELLEKLDAAREQTDSNLQKSLEERYRRETKERESRENEILSRLDSLLKDEAFVRLQTQRAMQTYALEKVPELVEVRSALLKSKIAKLYDNVKIRGLDRKK